MGMFVYDMIQDAVLKHLHYHQCDESMAHQLTIDRKQIFKTYILFMF